MPHPNGRECGQADVHPVLPPTSKCRTQTAGSVARPMFIPSFRPPANAAPKRPVRACVVREPQRCERRSRRRQQQNSNVRRHLALHVPTPLINDPSPVINTAALDMIDCLSPLEEVALGWASAQTLCPGVIPPTLKYEPTMWPFSRSPGQLLSC
eukprot:364894-Chlamydomonas_euryale.AAC.7